MISVSLAMKSENNFAYEIICFVLFTEFLCSNYLKSSILVLLKLEAPLSKLGGPLLKNWGSDAINKSKPLHCRNVHKRPLPTVQPLSLFKDLIGVSLEDLGFKIFNLVPVHVYMCVCINTCALAYMHVDITVFMGHMFTSVKSPEIM